MTEDSNALSTGSAAQSPFDQFRKWFSHAVMHPVQEPEAMILSTVRSDGQPSSRVVLMRSVEENGFIFFTNYRSRKGIEISHNANASILFFWQALGRQIRIEGKIEKVSAEISDAYFSTRPRMSQIGAWASDQSSVLKSRTELELKCTRYDKQFEGKEVTRPPHWGGFLLVPHYFEFWQGRDNRLHDRVCYMRESQDVWSRQLLSP